MRAVTLGRTAFPADALWRWCTVSKTRHISSRDFDLLVSHTEFGAVVSHPNVLVRPASSQRRFRSGSLDPRTRWRLKMSVRSARPYVVTISLATAIGICGVSQTSILAADTSREIVAVTP